jgi:hypothetical protein
MRIVINAGPRIERADLFAQYGDLHAQGVSPRQAAKVLEVPRRTLQGWRVNQEFLDESPAVVAFFYSVPGLAFLHRLVIAVHLVCVEIGACGIRLVCLLLKLTRIRKIKGLLALPRLHLASVPGASEAAQAGGGERCRGAVGDSRLGNAMAKEEGTRAAVCAIPSRRAHG